MAEAEDAIAGDPSPAGHGSSDPTSPLAPAGHVQPPPIRPGWEVLLVLGVSLGQSAVYSLLSIAEKLTRPEPLAQQTTTINSSVTPDRPWLDLSYQAAGIVFPLVPAPVSYTHLTLPTNREV